MSAERSLSNSVRNIRPVMTIPSRELFLIKLFRVPVDTSTLAPFKYTWTIGKMEIVQTGLTSLPSNLFRNTSVDIYLDLRDNALREIPAHLFSHTYHAMKMLLLTGNRIEKLSPELFRNLHHLHDLFLDDNNLQSLPGNLLQGTVVTNLYIFRNNITSLRENLFGDVGNSSLKQVQAQGNPVTHLSEYFLHGLTEQGELIINCNNISLSDVPSEKKVKCVSKTFLTVVQGPSRLAVILLSRGFTCTDADDYGVSVCTSCDVGTYTPIPSNNYCDPCPKGGFYQDEVGRYQLSDDQIGCYDCNNGTFVKDGRGNSPLSCQVCPEGTDKNSHAGYRACFCLKDYFRRDRFGKCELCPQTGLKCSNDHASITPGYYWNWQYSDLTQYKAFVSNLLQLNDRYDADHSSFNGTLPFVYACPQSFKCVNDKNEIEGNCQEGYRGFMCTICETGFYDAFGFCRRCPTIWAFLTEIIVIILITLSFCFCAVYFHRREHQSANRSIMDVAFARGKIVLGFYQILGEFWDSIDSVNWSGTVFQQISSWLNVLRFSFSALLVKPSCFLQNVRFTPYVTFTMNITTTTIVLLFFTCILGFRRFQALRWFILKIDPDKLIVLILLILFITYPSTCGSIFSLYAPTCQTFSLDENKLHNISLLRADLSLSCETLVHQRYGIAAYISTTYVVGFPVMLLFLMKKSLNQSNRSGERVLPRWWRFMSENYKDEFWFWEIIELIRKVSQTFIVIIFGWKNPVCILSTLCIALMFLSLHMSFRPMRSRFEHYLQLASLWALFLNMLIAAVPPHGPETSQVTASTTLLLVILDVSILCILIGNMLLQIGKLVFKSCISTWLARTSVNQGLLNEGTHEDLDRQDDIPLGPMDDESSEHTPLLQ